MKNGSVALTPYFSQQEEVPKLVRQENCHQRDREGNSHQKPAGLLPDPQRVKQGHVPVAQGERRQSSSEIVIELCAHDQRGEHGQQQEQQMQPVGASLAAGYNIGFGVGGDLEGVGNGLGRF